MNVGRKRQGLGPMKTMESWCDELTTDPPYTTPPRKRSGKNHNSYANDVSNAISVQSTIGVMVTS